MLTIHKFPFPIEDRFNLTMPRGATILNAECQLGQPCLWALVDTDEPMEDVPFHLY